eukprot:c24089_g1_i1 orf=515-1474(+)
MELTQLVTASERCGFPQYLSLLCSQQDYGRKLLRSHTIALAAHKAYSINAKYEGAVQAHVKTSIRKQLTTVPESFLSFTGRLVVKSRNAVVILFGDRPLQGGHSCKRNTESEQTNTDSETYFAQPADRSELAELRANAVRSTLIRKLSEANLYNRHLQRQLREKEKALVGCKKEMAVLQMEIQTLAKLAQELPKEGVTPGARKINGKDIESHLALRLGELHQHLLSQMKDIDSVRYQEVPLVWFGMAEDAKVMGSFDGWTQGEQMSPENMGAFTKFTVTLKLTPGRYEFKLLIDGEWQIFPGWPTVGDGLTKNNLLEVD